jgi:hypothetical protein
MNQKCSHLRTGVSQGAYCQGIDREGWLRFLLSVIHEVPGRTIQHHLRSVQKKEAPYRFGIGNVAFRSADGRRSGTEAPDKRLTELAGFANNQVSNHGGWFILPGMAYKARIAKCHRMS